MFHCRSRDKKKMNLDSWTSLSVPPNRTASYYHPQTPLKIHSVTYAPLWVVGESVGTVLNYAWVEPVQEAPRRCGRRRDPRASRPLTAWTNASLTSRARRVTKSCPPEAPENTFIWCFCVLLVCFLSGVWVFVFWCFVFCLALS